MKNMPWTCLPLFSNTIITTPPACHVLCTGVDRGLLRIENTLYLKTKCIENRSDLPSTKKASNLGYITKWYFVQPIIFGIMLSGRLRWIEDAAKMGYFQENTMHVRYKFQSVKVQQKHSLFIVRTRRCKLSSISEHRIHVVNLITAPAEATTCSARAVLKRRRECLVKLPGPGDRLRCVYFVFLGGIIICRLYGLTLSDRGQDTLQLRAFPIYFKGVQPVRPCWEAGKHFLPGPELALAGPVRGWKGISNGM